jgi:hypothetical protein
MNIMVWQTWRKPAVLLAFFSTLVMALAGPLVNPLQPDFGMTIYGVDYAG